MTNFFTHCSYRSRSYKFHSALIDCLCPLISEPSLARICVPRLLTNNTPALVLLSCTLRHPMSHEQQPPVTALPRHRPRDRARPPAAGCHTRLRLRAGHLCVASTSRRCHTDTEFGNTESSGDAQAPIRETKSSAGPVIYTPSCQDFAGSSGGVTGITEREQYGHSEQRPDTEFGRPSSRDTIASRIDLAQLHGKQRGESRWTW